MKTLFKLLLLAMLMHATALRAETGGSMPSAQSLAPAEMPMLQACSPPLGQRIDTAQVSQSDCCKGHKGVCGCRAGKIVCCDGTISPNCTCHSDWGMANRALAATLRAYLLKATQTPSQSCAGGVSRNVRIRSRNTLLGGSSGTCSRHSLNAAEAASHSCLR